MGEVLGVGVTHYPPLLNKPENYANILRGVLKSPRVPEEQKDPKNWPSPMQDEWEHEVERAYDHLERHKAAFRKVRQAIDDFKPDAVVIFGDDQYENFKEDIIPPFNVYCRDEFPTQTFYRHPDNMWGAPTDTGFNYAGAGQLAKDLADELIERDFPVPYSYKNLHFQHGLSHAFANALVYLDWDMQGFPYPLIPISVNCYGRYVISNRGGSASLQRPTDDDVWLDRPGPSGPTPASCFRLGRMVREILEERPERVVVMASSSWSHAFLVAKHYWLYPDRDFDQARFQELKRGEQRQWATLSNDEIYESGDQEFKNWICLSGAVEERRPEIIDYLDTWIFNSQKCFALFPPNGR